MKLSVFTVLTASTVFLMVVATALYPRIAASSFVAGISAMVGAPAGCVLGDYLGDELTGGGSDEGDSQNRQRPGGEQESEGFQAGETDGFRNSPQSKEPNLAIEVIFTVLIALGLVAHHLAFDPLPSGF